MKRSLHTVTIIVFGSACLLAQGADGVLEISQECALSGGCFSGDSAGFPVTITSPGSYRLTSNLAVDVSAVSDPKNTTAIEVNAERVTLDLGGFAIQGPASCTGIPTVTGCSPAATTTDGNGVSTAGFRNDLTVRNGTITGMGNSGVAMDAGGLLRDVDLRENAGFGLFAFDRVTVVGSRASRNGGVGFDVDSNAVISGCTATGNMGAGIDAGESVVMRNNVIRHNDREGIKAAENAVIVDNTVSANGAGLSNDGIQLSNNAGGGSGLVIGNTVNSQPGFGLDCSTSGNSSGYGRNTFHDNNTGSSQQVINDCIELETNLCDGNTSCP